MKKLGFLLLFSALFLLAGFTQSAYAQGKKQQVHVKTQIYCDHCNQCASCGQRLYNALHDEPGVRKVKVVAKDNEIIVTFNPKKTNTQRIEEIIANQGFDANERSANPEAYEKLDACCKK